MNTFFGEAEMQTLNDLQTIAKKYGMKIRFGFNTAADREIDYEILKKNDVSTLVIDIFRNHTDCLTIENVLTTHEKISYELYDPANNQSHTVVFRESSSSFNIDNYDCQKIELLYQGAMDIFVRGAIDNFIRDDYYFSYKYCPTIINGFGNAEPVIDFRVNHNEAALMVFSDLVCDFLKESKIKTISSNR